METKKCTTCGECKGVEEFYKGHNQCKGCLKERSAVYLANNKEKFIEKFKARNAAYNANNKEKIKERKAAYRANNIEKIKTREAAYNANNKEIIKEQKVVYRANNIEKFKAREAAYSANHKEKIKGRHAANIKNIADPYLNNLLKKRGINPSTVPPELKEQFKEYIQLKRQLKK